VRFHIVVASRSGEYLRMTLFETERLLFRAHEPGDLDDYCALEADPEVRRYVGGAPRPRALAEQRFRERLLPPPSDRLGLWAAVLKRELRWIGYCGAYPHMLIGGAAAIPYEGALGFAFARAYWGRGLATEAARAFVSFGLGELRLTRIVATVQQGNLASLRVLQKSGFREVRFEKGEAHSYHHLEVISPPVR
jgi:RimJ/RimL family protein N-acetyltransferase